MTPDPIELVQQLSDAWNTRDVDAVTSLYAPDATYQPEGLAVCEGREAIRGFLKDWIEAYEDWEIEVEERRDLGGGVVLIVSVQRGRMPGSSAWVALRGASVAIWEAGLIKRFTSYYDIDQARAAAERLAEERR